MKKIFVLLIAVIFIVSTGCATSGVKNKSDKGKRSKYYGLSYKVISTEKDTTTKPDSTDVIKRLTYKIVLDATDIPRDKDLKKLIKKFLKGKKNKAGMIDVDVYMPGTDTDTWSRYAYGTYYSKKVQAVNILIDGLRDTKWWKRVKKLKKKKK